MKSRTTPKRAAAALCALGLLAPGPLAPQVREAPPETISLDELVEEAREQNPSVQAARHRADAAAARVPQAGALPDPNLFTGLMYVPVPDLDLSAEGMTMFSLQVTQRIPVPGSRGLREEEARRKYEASRREAEESEAQVVAELKASYHELVFTHHAERILRRNRALLEDLAAVAGARLAVDRAPQQDVLRAQTEVTRIDDQLSALQGRRTQALAEINRVLDRQPLHPVTPEYPGAVADLALSEPPPWAFTASALERGLGPPFPGLEELQEAAIRSRPALLAHVERIAAARERRDLAIRQRWPDVSWMAAYSPRSGRRDMVSVGLSLDLPLFRGRKQDHAVLEAEAELSDHEARHHDMVAQIRSEVAERYEVLLRTRERIVLLDQGVIPQAEATVESALGAYQTGRMEFAGLLEAQATLFRNEIERVRLLADFGAELAALEAAVGAEIELEEENR